MDSSSSASGLRTVQGRVLRAFRRRGLLSEDAARDMLTWQGTGGFSVEASVRIEGDDRSGVERLNRISWARLLARIYEVLPLLCPASQGEIRIVSFLTDPPTVRAILHHLGVPDRPPPLTPARAPPPIPSSPFAISSPSARVAPVP